jgi:hypothetical protein
VNNNSSNSNSGRYGYNIFDSSFAFILELKVLYFNENSVWHM